MSDKISLFYSPTILISFIALWTCTYLRLHPDDMVPNKVNNERQVINKFMLNKWWFTFQINDILKIIPALVIVSLVVVPPWPLMLSKHILAVWAYMNHTFGTVDPAKEIEHSSSQLNRNPTRFDLIFFMGYIYNVIYTCRYLIYQFLL